MARFDAPSDEGINIALALIYQHHLLLSRILATIFA
jgi:hypothetical protein